MSVEKVLITGASSGLGVEFAKLFAADKSDLILVARRRDKLEALAAELRRSHGVQVHVLCHDLAVPGAAEKIYAELGERQIRVDVLINNAGFGAQGSVATVPVQKQIDMIYVNVVALTHLTRLVLPGMLERGRGSIMNVGSVAGYLAGPFLSVYYATKAYVLSFSEALAVELQHTPVHVTLLAPGPTATGFEEAADLQNSPLFKFGTMEATEVARLGYQALRRGKRVAIPGIRNKLNVYLTHLLPRGTVAKVAGMLNAGRSAPPAADKKSS